MSSLIEARFLGAPVIRKDGKEIFFPYNKVNALVYYILVKGTVLRDELSGILWADKSDAMARKNLRNALYETKKILGAEVFISPRKAIIKVNPDIRVSVDVKKFETNPGRNLELYQGAFLQGFFIKDAAEYESWYLTERDRLESIYMEALLQKLKDAVAVGNLPQVTRYGRMLLKHDPYDESIYTLLLRTYCEQGNMKQATELYEEMKQLFREELQTSVPPEIERLMRDHLHQEKTRDAAEPRKVRESVPGREAEQAQLQGVLQQFLTGQPTRTLLLRGDAGSGKTTLKEALVRELPPDVAVIQTNCFQPEQNIPLRPWTGIVEGLDNLVRRENIRIPNVEPGKLSDLFPQMDMSGDREAGLAEVKDLLKFDAVFHTLYTVLENAAQVKRILVVIEDIHWMDSLSLSLLSSLILHKRSDRFLFLLTAQPSREKNYQQFETSVTMYHKLQILELKPLDLEGVRRYAGQAGLAVPVDDKLAQRLWEESEGNLFLLRECLLALKTTGSLDNLTENMRNIFKASCFALTDNQQKILDFISLFYDGAPLAMISEYMHMNNLQTLENMESLRKANFIRPVPQQPEVIYKLVHQKMKDYLQQQIAVDKQRILHSYIASLWEKRLTHSPQDIRLYHHLEYHYQEAGELVNMGRYKLKILMYYLNFSNELFPVLSSAELVPDDTKSRFIETNLDQFLAEVDEMMHTIKRTCGETPEVKELEMTYLHLMGRHYIRVGEYEKGVRNILNLIEQAAEVHNRDYMLMGYKQMIYYDIQIGNTEEMKNYLEVALNLADECNYHKEMGILLRLKGLNMIMQGNFPEAERLLKESISTFMVTQNVQHRYALNIAGAYNYLGEIRRGEGKFQEALDEYSKALEYAKGQEAYSSWVVFSCNAGVACYNMGRYEEAKKYFFQAYELFPCYVFYWRHPIVESYLALLSMREGKEKEATGYLDDALHKLGNMNNPREAGYVYMAIALLKQKYPESRIADHYEGSVGSYATKALQVLDPYRDSWERQQLEALF
ncbi:MAG: AAA family ATPase [Acidaminococcus sp.]|uniref:AAA family ATPase n=1 Tax=Acidaminococcus sp. TaxID=1872103 RepID=UPI003F14768F